MTKEKSNDKMYLCIPIYFLFIPLYVYILFIYLLFNVGTRLIQQEEFPPLQTAVVVCLQQAAAFNVEDFRPSVAV